MKTRILLCLAGISFLSSCIDLGTEKAAVPKDRPDISKAIKANLKASWDIKGEEQAWYVFIKDIKVTGSEVTVSTKLPPKGEATRDLYGSLARSICQGVSGEVFSDKGAKEGLDTVFVEGQADLIWVTRRGITGSCDP